MIYKFKNFFHKKSPDRYIKGVLVIRHEAGCAVLVAVKGGQLTEKSYLNYVKMTREARYHEMSYLERRQKDKKFGKHIKSVMRHKKKT
jgi:ribosome biogenesis GTPase